MKKTPYYIHTSRYTGQETLYFDNVVVITPFVLKWLQEGNPCEVEVNGGEYACEVFWNETEEVE